MISVVIPVHNQAKTLARALKSVLEQCVDDLEIIVVDDGSTDEIAAVMAEFENPRVAYLRQQNHGPAAARNAGIRASHGELIAFLDADDFWLPGKLKAQLAAMKTTGRRFSFCGSHVVDEHEKVTASRPANADDGSFFKLIWGNALATPTMVIKRELLDECGVFDESLRSGEDWDLWLRLSLKETPAVVEQPLVAVQSEKDWGADEMQFRGYDYSVRVVLERAFAMAAQSDHFDVVLSQKKKIMSWHYSVLAKSFLERRNIGRGLYYFCKCIFASRHGLVFIMPNLRD